jgi:succinoglycan biosynthesis protein ExoL
LAVRRQKNSGKTIVFFEPDLTETTTIARVKEFVDSGFDPVVFGFRRARYNKNYTAPWPAIELGRTQDARYWNRIKALFGALPAIIKNRCHVASNAIFLARNLDQLLLALFARLAFNSSAVLAYEVVDIQPAFTRRGVRGTVIRWMERRCIKHVDLLIVSSPAFIHHYFATTQRYRGEWVLVENKLRESTLAASYGLQQRSGMSRSLRAERRWVIGYFGLIRGQATIELIVRLAKALPDTIEVHFRGVLTTVDHPWFHKVVAETENIRYDGAYTNPDDLPALYGGVDLAWAIDLEDTKYNSRWLLPCRFYEAGFFGVPCLAVRSFEVGRLIDCLGVGWTFDAPLEPSLIRFFKSLNSAAYEQKHRRLLASPVSAFVAGEEDRLLCQTLERLARLDPKDGAPVSFEKQDNPGAPISARTLEGQLMKAAD